MAYDFDSVIDRRATSSTKWVRYGPDLLPFWVADMDFKSPPGLLAAVEERLRHGVLGYTDPPPAVEDAFLEWLMDRFGWSVPREWLLWLPGVVPGLNLAGRVIGDPGESILIPVPVYHPFLSVPRQAGKEALFVDLVRDRGRWVMDMDRLEDAVQPSTRGLLLCSPQNPTGRAYDRSELEALVGFCLRHDLTLVSDEIHCDLLLDATACHVPTATLNPELRCISLFSPNKAYNMPGLSLGVAVIADPVLRNNYEEALLGLGSGVSPLAFAAALWAYTDRSDWLRAVTAYLSKNRDLLEQTVAKLDGVEMTHVEATYLGWIDVSALALDDACAHFDRFGIRLSDGEPFGAPGFQRFNFGCPRITLQQGLSLFEEAVRNP
ncbi:MAG: PatB family C-S lyase [Gammaproteobacteria bacterium]|nr:PatB family C-S lyase [Gammaproteobacteria bacterium]